MTLVPSTSFYVTLMSHASTREFPQNRAYHFKNRLPKPIRFVGRPLRTEFPEKMEFLGILKNS